MNNFSMEAADRETHVRIVAASLTFAILVAWFSMAIAH
jgi:hypothetical protein